jgi:hypothetical protein
LKHLDVSTLEVSTLGLIPQCLMADPTEHEASCLIRHPQLDTTPGRDPVIIFEPLERHRLLSRVLRRNYSRQPNLH